MFTNPKDLQVRKILSLNISSISYSNNENFVFLKAEKAKNDGITINTLKDFKINSLFVSILEGVKDENKGNFYIKEFLEENDYFLISIYIKNRKDNTLDQDKLDLNINIFFCVGIDLKVLSEEEESFFDRSVFNHEIIYDDIEKRLKICNIDDTIKIANLSDLQKTNSKFIDFNKKEPRTLQVKPGDFLFCFSDKYENGINSYLVLDYHEIDCNEINTYPENNLDKFSFFNYSFQIPIKSFWKANNDSFLEYPDFIYGDITKKIKPSEPFSIENNGNMILPDQVDNTVTFIVDETEKLNQKTPANLISGTSNNTDPEKWLNENLYSGDGLSWNFRNSNENSHIIDIDDFNDSNYVLLNFSDTNVNVFSSFKIFLRTQEHLGNQGEKQRGFILVDSKKIKVKIPEKWTFNVNSKEEINNILKNVKNAVFLEDPENFEVFEDLRSTILKFILNGVEYFYVAVVYNTNMYFDFDDTETTKLKFLKNEKRIALYKIKNYKNNLNINADNGILLKNDWNSIPKENKEILVYDLFKECNYFFSDNYFEFYLNNEITIEPDDVVALEFLSLNPFKDVSYFKGVDAVLEANSYISDNICVLEPSSKEYSPYFLINNKLCYIRKNNMYLTKVDEFFDRAVLYKLNECFLSYNDSSFEEVNVNYGQIAIRTENIKSIFYEWVNPKIKQFQTKNDLLKLQIEAQTEDELPDEAFIQSDRKLYKKQPKAIFTPFKSFQNQEELEDYVFENYFTNERPVILNSIYRIDNSLFKVKNISVLDNITYFLIDKDFKTKQDLDNFLESSSHLIDTEFFKIFSQNRVNLVYVSQEKKLYKIEYINYKIGKLQKNQRLPEPSLDPKDWSFFYLNSNDYVYYITKDVTFGDRVIWKNLGKKYSQFAEKVSVFKVTSEEIKNTKDYLALNTEDNQENDNSVYSVDYIPDENQIRTKENGCFWNLIDTENNLNNYIYYVFEGSSADLHSNIFKYFDLRSVYSSVYFYIVEENSFYFLNRNQNRFNWVSYSPKNTPKDIENVSYSFENKDSLLNSLKNIKDNVYLRCIDSSEISGFFNFYYINGNLEEQNSFDLIFQDQLNFTSESQRDTFFENNPTRLIKNNKDYCPFCKIGNTYYVYTDNIEKIFYVNDFYYFDKRIALKRIVLEGKKDNNLLKKLKDDTIYYIFKIYKDYIENDEQKRKLLGIGSDTSINCENLLEQAVLNNEKGNSFSIIGAIKTLKNGEYIFDTKTKKYLNFGVQGYLNPQSPLSLLVNNNDKIDVNTSALSALHDYFPFKKDWVLNKTENEAITNNYVSYEVIEKPYKFTKHIDFSTEENNSFISFQDEKAISFDFDKIEFYKKIQGDNLKLKGQTIKIKSDSFITLQSDIIKLKFKRNDIKFKFNDNRDIFTITNNLVNFSLPVGFNTWVVGGNEIAFSYRDNCIQLYKDFKIVRNDFNIYNLENEEIIQIYPTGEDGIVERTVKINAPIDGVSMRAMWSDFAEFYKSKKIYDAGLIVDLDEEGFLIPAVNNVLGVISKDAGFVIGEEIIDDYKCSNPVVMIGKSIVMLDKYSLEHKNELKVNKKLYLSKKEKGKATILESGLPLIGKIIEPNLQGDKIFSLLVVNI